jgi:uncharacterized protein YgbK (DUF1537 family)
MVEVLVVADDLTGANAAAAGFARLGLRAVTASAAQRADVVAEMVARFDVVVATTDSRHDPPTVAKERVAAVIRAGWPARLVCNRVDTTLRGNIGASTAAVLDEVRSLTGSHVVVLCAPAHPAAGRHTIAGTQLLRGRRLEETEVARDARTPMDTSDVVEILRQQADLVASVVPMATVTGSADDLVAAIRDAVSAGAHVVVADATTEEHLDRVAAAAAEVARGTDLVWVTSDPGPASVALARALGLAEDRGSAPLLVVSGSATELTRTQLRQLAAKRGTVVHRTPCLGDTAVPDVDATTALIGKLLTEAGSGEVVALATVLDESDLRGVTPDEAEQVPRALARAVRRNLEEHTVDGVFTTGGDVTSALLAELGSQGLEISDEVVPLAVAGSVVGGPWDGLNVVTKGGLVGDADTTVACLDHLRRTAEMRRRQVRSVEPRRHHGPP